MLYGGAAARDSVPVTAGGSYGRTRVRALGGLGNGATDPTGGMRRLMLVGALASATVLGLLIWNVVAPAPALRGARRR